MAAVDAADGFSHEGCDADDADFFSGRLGDGVGGDHFLDGGVFEALVAHFAKNGVGDAGEDALGTVFGEDFGRGAEGAGGFGHVVDEEDVAALDFADDVHGLHPGGADAVFGDDGELGAESVGVGAGHFHAADVGRDDGEVGCVGVAFLQVAEKSGLGVKMVDRDVEKALDLGGVQVHREDAVDPGGGEEVGDQFRGDGDARLVFPVLPGVAEKGYHRGDPLRAGAACGVHHDEEFHDVVVGGRTGGLDDENVGTTDVFIDFDEGFSIGEGRHMDIRERLPEAFGDVFGKGAVGGSTDEFHGRFGGGAGGLLTALLRWAILCADFSNQTFLIFCPTLKFPPT